MTTEVRGKTGTFNCVCCGKPFVARLADRHRGWARHCSKSCKAKKQEQRTGQYAGLLASNRTASRSHLDKDIDEDWDYGDLTYWDGKDYG